MDTESVVLTDVNTDVAAVGTEDMIALIRSQLSSGEIKVFDTATFTVNGETLESYLADVDSDPVYEADTEVIFDGYFHESEFRSAPYFDIDIDGIVFLDN